MKIKMKIKKKRQKRKQRLCPACVTVVSLLPDPDWQLSTESKQKAGLRRTLCSTNTRIRRQQSCVLWSLCCEARLVAAAVTLCRFYSFILILILLSFLSAPADGPTREEEKMRRWEHDDVGWGAESKVWGGEWEGVSDRRLRALRRSSAWEADG